MITKKKNAFTLVELLAVIVILAIVLVIAVPKVMNVIEDSKKATLESTAKMIASAAEKAKMQNTLLGTTETITCESVAKINNVDYSSCKVEFEGNTAKVTIQGSGKFAGLNICEGTKTNSIAQKEACSPKIKSIEVEHPTFLRGQSITPQQFKVNATFADGSTRVLESQAKTTTKEGSESTTITSPNWPENYSVGLTEEVCGEVSYEGAVSMQITFDATSETVLDDPRTGQSGDLIKIYDKNGTVKQTLSGNRFAGSTITIGGNYIKITMTSAVGGKKGFSATVKPMYEHTTPAEYTVSPEVVPNTGENFDITITVTGQNISKKISTKSVYKIGDYVSNSIGTYVQQMTAEYNGTQYDAGIRYTGSYPVNYVYYNCEETDSNGVSYENNSYDYAGSCERWRIVGLFNVEDGKGNTEKRVKLVNTSSTFKASWDVSEGGMDDKGVCSGINCGQGINQWGESKYSNGSVYEGADLMRLLNGYYTGKEGSKCTYMYLTSTWTFENEERTCTIDSLKTVNMKPLTSVAKNMIDDAVWDTYAVNAHYKITFKNEHASEAYLEEKGISTKVTGKTCTSGDFCNDSVIRTASWTGLVGLVSSSDIAYANGWLNLGSDGWVITPYYTSHPSSNIIHRGSLVWYSYRNSSNDLVGSQGNGIGCESNAIVSPAVYLLPDVKIISGNGGYDKPYILSLN